MRWPLLEISHRRLTPRKKWKLESTRTPDPIQLGSDLRREYLQSLSLGHFTLDISPLNIFPRTFPPPGQFPSFLFLCVFYFVLFLVIVFLCLCFYAFVLCVLCSIGIVTIIMGGQHDGLLLSGSPPILYSHIIFYSCQINSPAAFYMV